jgi:hypothetical protein
MSSKLYYSTVSVNPIQLLFVFVQLLFELHLLILPQGNPATDLKSHFLLC